MLRAATCFYYQKALWRSQFGGLALRAQDLNLELLALKMPRHGKKLGQIRGTCSDSSCLTAHLGESLSLLGISGQTMPVWLLFFQHKRQLTGKTKSKQAKNGQTSTTTD